VPNFPYLMSFVTPNPIFSHKKVAPIKSNEIDDGVNKGMTTLGGGVANWA